MALAPGQVRDLSPAVVRRYFGDYTLVRGGTATPFPRIVRFGTHGDGTCFFHSVCAALNVDGYLERSLKERQKIGHDFRCRFTDHLTSERWARFLRQTNAGTTYDKKDADVARKAFCTTREWADEQMIRWTSVVLRKNIIFIDQSNRRIYCGVRGDPEKQDTIVIMWIAKSHYEPSASSTTTTSGASACSFSSSSTRSRTAASSTPSCPSTRPSAPPPTSK